MSHCHSQRGRGQGRASAGPELGGEAPAPFSPGAGLAGAAVPAPSRLASPSAAHPPARSRGQTVSHLSLTSVASPKGLSCRPPPFNPLPPPPRTAGEGRTRDRHLRGGCTWPLTRLDSYCKCSGPGPGESCPSESTTPVGQQHPCVTGELDGIQAGLSGERRGPRGSRDAWHCRGGARRAGSRGKDGSSRCGCGPRTPPPTAALFSR